MPMTALPALTNLTLWERIKRELTLLKWRGRSDAQKDSVMTLSLCRVRKESK